MLEDKQNYKLGLLVITLAMVLLYWGFKKWLVNIPQALPTQAASASKSSLSSGYYYETSIAQNKRDNYLSGDYRVWIPDEVEEIRGLIVKQHGCGNGDSLGLNHANDPQWQALASKHQFALLGARLPADYPMCTNEALVDNAAEDTFLKAISVLGQKSQHQELDTVPWVIWGHSGGADWATQMLEHYPDRILAVISVHAGGIRSTSGNSEILNLDANSKLIAKLLDTPVLWLVGAKDHCVEECLELPQKIYYKFHQVNSLWTLALGPKTTHKTGDTRLLAIPYLDAIATARIGNNGELRSLDPKQGWIGNIATKKVVPAEQYNGNAHESAWLPDRETALKWQQYVTYSKILPLRKSNPPTNVTVTKISPAKKLIEWDYAPDLENGVPDFRIYRDGSLIKTLQGHRYDYGDVATRPDIVLKFVDANAKDNSTYAVTAFNQQGETTPQSAVNIQKQ